MTTPDDELSPGHRARDDRRLWLVIIGLVVVVLGLATSAVIVVTTASP